MTTQTKTQTRTTKEVKSYSSRTERENKARYDFENLSKNREKV